MSPTNVRNGLPVGSSSRKSVARPSSSSIIPTSPANRPQKKHEPHCENVTADERVTHYNPPHLLGYTSGGGKSVVTFELTPKGEDVLLVITETGLPSREDLVSNSGGWHAHADLLLGVLSGASERPFWSKIKELDFEYAKGAPE
jgi:hypothetical protein